MLDNNRYLSMEDLIGFGWFSPWLDFGSLPDSYNSITNEGCIPFSLMHIWILYECIADIWWMLIEISNHRIGEVQHQQEGAKGMNQTVPCFC